jgi:hypothetical protein
MAKNQNSAEKRRREVEKKFKAEEKRKNRVKKKFAPPEVFSSSPTQNDIEDKPVDPE